MWIHPQTGTVHFHDFFSQGVICKLFFYFECYMLCSCTVGICIHHLYSEFLKWTHPTYYMYMYLDQSIYLLNFFFFFKDKITGLGNSVRSGSGCSCRNGLIWVYTACKHIHDIRFKGKVLATFFELSTGTTLR